MKEVGTSWVNWGNRGAKTIGVASAGAIIALFATYAKAQSAVTLYGIIDGGVTYSNNTSGHSVVSASSGKLGGSRWGLRGRGAWWWDVGRLRFGEWLLCSQRYARPGCPDVRPPSLGRYR